MLLEDVTTTRGTPAPSSSCRGPFTTTTSDDGSFTFNELPEGTLSVAFFRQGYRTRSLDALPLRSGEELPLATLTLRRETSPQEPVVITGRIRLDDGGPAPATTVILTSMAERREVLTGLDGRFEATGLMPGLFSLAASRDGSLTARVSNISALSDASSCSTSP